jgi:hypothetical protein
MHDELLFQSIEETGRRLDLDDSLIEKDYYVTQVINVLSKAENEYLRCAV